MEFAYLNGRIALGIASSADYIEWAMDRLQRGDDSESLAILAGLELEGEADSQEVRRYFNRAVDELGLVPPSRDRALLDYARYFCRQIFEGRIASTEGLKRLDALFPASGYAELYSLWDGLSEDLAFLQEEGRSYFNSGLGTHNSESYIRDVARQFLVLTEHELPADFFALKVCAKCGYIGLPGSSRVQDAHFSERPFPRLNGPMLQVEACAGCGASHPMDMADYKARQRYLEWRGW
jgi:hypothetical protein